VTKCKALRDTLCSVALSEAQPTDDLNSACCAASFIFLLLYSSFYLHLATSEMSCWSRGRGILTELSLCCSSVYHYNGAQRYEQFLRVSRLDRALILLGLAPYHPSASVSSIFMVHWCCIQYIVIFWLHLFIYLLASWAWWDWPLTWLTNHCPLVLWHCWLWHTTCKILCEMTYNVSSGTLNPTIPYHSFSRCLVTLFKLRDIH